MHIGLAGCAAGLAGLWIAAAQACNGAVPTRGAPRAAPRLSAPKHTARSVRARRRQDVRQLGTHPAPCAPRPAGNILLIDEIHTPDSSRYWIADTYEERHAEVGRSACLLSPVRRCAVAPSTLWHCLHARLHRCQPQALAASGGCMPCLRRSPGERALSLHTHPTWTRAAPQGQEPQNIDKEFLRLWFRANCDPYNDPVRGLRPRPPCWTCLQAAAACVGMWVGVNRAGCAAPATAQHCLAAPGHGLHPPSNPAPLHRRHYQDPGSSRRAALHRLNRCTAAHQEHRAMLTEPALPCPPLSLPPPAGAARGAGGAAQRAVPAVRAAVREDHGAGLPAGAARGGAGGAHPAQRGGGSRGAVMAAWQRPG